jgi:RHS repeat-associated protein
VVATLKVNGTPRGQGVWRGSAWPDVTGPVRIAVGYDASSDSTGPYRYTLEVRAHYGETALATTARGELVVVNRRESVFGAGWWLAGLERLVMDPFGKPVLWVGGDGSTRRYTKAGGADVWGAPSLDRPDSIKPTTSGGWERILGGGVKVEFDSTGRHVATVNRLEHRTEFRYDSAGRVDTVSIPRAERGFSFHYAVDGKLERMESPGVETTPRSTHLHRTGARVDSIRNPDGSRIRFGYANAARALVPTFRASRAGVTSYFRFDHAGLVAGARLDPNATDSIVMRLRAVESLGLANTGALDTARAYALIDGPRTDVGDSTRFWLNRWGAPRRVVNPLGQQAVLTYGDARYPALVTESRSPGGLVSRAWYDARGRVDSSTVLSPYGDGRNATTRYAWDAKWDVVTRTASPEGVIASFGYDSVSGNLMWQQTGADASQVDSTRVEYGYDPATRLVGSVAEAGATQPSRYEYDGRGNLKAVVSALGFRSEFYSDALGRDTLVLTPTDAAQTPGLRVATRTWFDASGRDSLTRTYGPSLGDRYTGARTLWVETLYTTAGQVRTVRRWGEPQLSPDHPTQFIRRFEYDAAGRDTAEFNEVNRAEKRRYDPAGNVVSVQTRRGPVVSMRYDALNRLVRRSTEAVENPEIGTSGHMSASYPAFTDGYPIPAEVDTLAYDSIGNLVLADNPYAKIRRGYHPNGTVAWDSTFLRSWAGSPNDPAAFAGHAYGIGYGYDLDGRRSWLEYPANLAPGAESGAPRTRATYEYTPRTGALAAVVNVFGHRHAFHFDRAARLRTALPADGSRESFTYDADGRLRSRTHATAGGSVFRNDTMRYDARAKLLGVWMPGGGPSFRYDALGTLVEEKPIYETTTDKSMRKYIVDALGHRVKGFNKFQDSLIYGLEQNDRATGWRHPFYPDSGAGEYMDESDTFADANGSESWRESVSGGPNQFNIEQAMSFYDGRDKLRAVDRRACPWVADTKAVGTPPDDYQPGWIAYERTLGKCDPQVVLAPERYGGLEEYRYDALGRRIAVRFRPDAACTACATLKMAHYTRYVWDGDQVLHEVRSPDESDHPQDSPSSAAYGRVGYTHGGVIDAPLDLIRIGHAGDTATVIVPLRNALGQHDRGSIVAGPSVSINWPGAHWNAFRKPLDPYPKPGGWAGSLITGSADQSGLQYMRNRYYDPRTGQFTQQDPIGLAGGLNTYGFANGDPVTYSDPYGLLASTGECPPCSGWEYFKNEVWGLRSLPMRSNQEPATLYASASVYFWSANAGVRVDHRQVKGSIDNSATFPSAGAGVAFGAEYSRARAGEHEGSISAGVTKRTGVSVGVATGSRGTRVTTVEVKLGVSTPTPAVTGTIKPANRAPTGSYSCAQANIGCE